ncbi:hypothetical protein V6N12_016757 [Hibiscus sabdariffa]|uniref:Uncharacterized protein n=1 Tax=Hibiscus sabdariffa TaxID=183260 RepID=A0ABR2CEL1_9ROSI
MVDPFRWFKFVWFSIQHYRLFCTSTIAMHYDMNSRHGLVRFRAVTVGIEEFGGGADGPQHQKLPNHSIWTHSSVPYLTLSKDHSFNFFLVLIYESSTVAIENSTLSSFGERWVMEPALTVARKSMSYDSRHRIWTKLKTMQKLEEQMVHEVLACVDAKENI